MGAVQRGRWYLMALLFLPFLRVAFPQKDPITVPLDEGMVLDCVCPWQGTFGMVSWTKVSKKDPIAVFHPEHGTYFSHQYRDRIDFLRSSPMDGSISLRNVTHQDMGLYVCSIQTFPEGSWRKSFQVEDLDEPPEDDDNNSTETQGAMQAYTQLVAEQHGNATIACDPRNVATAGKVTLDRRASPEEPWGVVGECRVSGGGPVVQNASGRGVLICAHGLDLRLHLADVEPKDAGLYRCTWSEGGAWNTTVMLRVQPAGGFSLSAYMKYIYIGAGAAAFILLVVVLVVVLATRRKRRRSRVEYRVNLNSQRPIHNFYENISVCPRTKAKQSKECPIYINLLTVQAHKKSGPSMC